MKSIRSRSCAIIIALLIALPCSAALAQAPSGQGYPSKPIRLVLPFPAGSPSDMVGRTLGQKLAEQLGQNVVPDNRVGAGGNLGIGAAAKSPPDGYTILVTSPTIAISPSLYSNLTYDAARDLAPVARLATIENVMVVHPSVPTKTLKQFIALARAHPGKLNFGSGGPGTTNHLANELLKSLERINIVHVPYKGATQAMLALIGGEVDEVIVAVAPALPQIRAGKVRPIAVLSERRVAALPDVPTAKEAGVDKFNMSIWYGLFAPAGTPADLIARLNQEATRALESNELRERMTVMGIDPWPGTAEQLGSLVRSETARYAGIVKSAGLRRE
jgi:tripartite-type tricarboxylate transporter receptor subunit TctC